MFKNYEDVVTYGKDNMDALVRSSTLWAKGMQDLSNAYMGFAQSSFEDSMAATKEIMGCRNLKEIADLQAKLAKSGYEKFVRESGRLSETSIKVAEEAMEPLASRMSTTMERFGQQQPEAPSASR